MGRDAAGARGVRTSGRTRVVVLSMVATLALLVAASGCSETRSADGPRGAGGSKGASVSAGGAVRVLSGRPDMVAGGQLVVGLGAPGSSTPAASTTTAAEVAERVAPTGAPDVQVTAKVQGRSLDAIARRERDGSLSAVVAGLGEGAQKLSVEWTGPGGQTGSGSVEVVNHPITGPVFSGPQLPMPVCSTEAYGLGAPVDDACSAAKPVVTWSYVDVAGMRHDLAEGAALPADAGRTDDGRALVIRTEKGTINRGIYTIEVLDPDRASGIPPWNGRVVFGFGGGCGATYTQGFNLMGNVSTDLLARGYLYATSTLDTFQVTCNDVLSAETAMMVREYVAETYGVPEFVIGSGGSGGAIQQYLIAQNYPGILDALAVTLPFPDHVSIAGGVVDCMLLNRFYEQAGAGWSDPKQVAVNGHLTTGTCRFWEQTFAQNINPAKGCSLALLDAAGGFLAGLPEGGIPKLDPADIYDPVNNRDGLRCTLQDSNVNILGRDPDTGFARRPLDNTGVQYGLGALTDQVISFDEFVALNKGIGGFDVDGQWQATRIAADPEAVKVVYETGRIIEGGGDLRRIPIVTVNVWTDDQGDIHDRFRAFTVRERLSEDGKASPNMSIWTRGLPEGQSLAQSLAGALDLGSELVTTLDTWLTTGDRPDDAADNCITATGERVSGEGLYDQPGPCVDPYPVSGDPRTVAGQSLRNDIVKCRLQPVSEASAAGLYGSELSAAQVSKLEEVFPDGVCDYSKAGVGQVRMGPTWRSYGP